MNAPPSLRAEHDAMLARLSIRASTLHFAHCAVSFFVGCLLGGAAVKLSLDTELAWAPSLVLPAAALAIIAALYAVVRLALGLRVLRGEERDFERLQALRAQLKLDDPAALLPATRLG
ncbi:MAG: hypothetical protein JNJ54_34805 [Myxococcaceae bacterium]|nr:hypothetical protein [Myxococcaceae bacterium]